MEWLERLNKSVDYIENNLADEISYERAAQIACCSTYHYQRMSPEYRYRNTFAAAA